MYKNKISCIYEIRNIINNKIYIGSTNHFAIRKINHVNHLRRGIHHSISLQRAWNKYGENNFMFDILMYVEPKYLFIEEQKFLDEWKPEYNISKTSKVPVRVGYKHSQETIEKIRKANTGKKRSNEFKKNCSIIFSQRKYSDETKRKHAENSRGKEYTAKVHGGLISPDGTIYENIFNMSKFCREHNLSRSKISELELTNGEGRRHKHRGWSLYKGETNNVAI